MTSDAAADPLREGAARRAAKRSRFKAWMAAVIVLAAFAFVYLLLLWNAEGDYLLAPTTSCHFSLRCRPAPSVAYSDSMGAAPDGRYWIVPSGIAIDQYPASGFISGASGGAPPDHFVLKPGGGDSLFRVDSSYLERFPLGSLARFDQALRTGEPLAAAQDARELERLLPDRLAPKYWSIALLCAAGEEAQARARLDEQRGAFERSAHPWAKGMLRLLEADVEAATTEQWDRRRELDAAIGAAMGMGTPAARYSRPATSFEEQMAFLAKQVDLPPLRLISLSPTYPDFLSMQIASKCARVRAAMLQILGRREEALRLLRGAHRFARFSPPLASAVLHCLSGGSCEYVFRGLEDALVHATWSADDLRRHWETLERDFAIYPAFDDTSGLELFAGFQRDDLDELFKYAQMAEARRQLLRESIRARHYRLVHGRWPDRGAKGELLGLELEPLTPIRDPLDPAGGPIRSAESISGLILYSVGFDGKDDGGSLEQKPIHLAGAGSTPGDITLFLDFAPRFDFPTVPGYVYQGREDILARYPKGFPLDPFSNGGVSSLRQAEDGTNRLWSFGPDADEGVGPVPDPRRHLLWHYDPTNGTTSTGDIWVVLPMADAASGDTATSGATGTSATSASSPNP